MPADLPLLLPLATALHEASDASTLCVPGEPDAFGEVDPVLIVRLQRAGAAMDALMGDLWDAEPHAPVSAGDLGLVRTAAVAVLGHLVVPPSLRSQGFGRFLLAQAERWAQARGAKAMLVIAGNPETGGGPPTPIPFYRREGYVAVSTYDLVALMVKRLDDVPLRWVGVPARSTLIPNVEAGDLPPELPPAFLAHLRAVARQNDPGPNDAPCAVVSDAVVAEAYRLGVPLAISNAGCRVDPSHVYVVLHSQDPRWHLAILDFTVGTFITHGSPWQATLTGTYPRAGGQAGLALVPPGHPFYAAMGYNPDPNVGTIEDPASPSWRGGRPPSGAWRPPATHALWRAWDPEQQIDYPERGQTEDDRIARAVAAVQAIPGWLLTDEGETWEQEQRRDEYNEKTFSSEDWRRIRREAGLPILGNGGSRVVFDLGRGKVLKVAFPDNEGCTLEEAHTWEQAPPAVRALLVPVLAYHPHGLWLIMALARPFSPAHDPPRLYLDRCHRLGDRCDAASFFLRGYDDAARSQNWGWHRGRLKLLDYAGVDCVQG